MATRYQHTWRRATGITEAQARIIAALIAARRLGYDGATVDELAAIRAGTAGHSSRMRYLAKQRLVVSVGYTSERHPRKVWAPSERAYRVLGVEP